MSILPKLRIINNISIKEFFLDLLLSSEWQDILKEEMEKEYFFTLREFLNEEYALCNIFPPREEIFAALNLTGYKEVKVVILGQDPYHGAGQAHGLCFSVNPHVKIPPSLKNIYKELERDLNCRIPSHGFLQKWAEQGVLLLNNVLTVREGKAHSHKNRGWETLTKEIIRQINRKEEPVVFLLWGAQAQEKEALIDNSAHLVLKAPHPSPLSAYKGFLGCGHFSETNRYLQERGRTPIDWQIEESF